MTVVRWVRNRSPVLRNNMLKLLRNAQMCQNSSEPSDLVDVRSAKGSL